MKIKKFKTQNSKKKAESKIKLFLRKVNPLKSHSLISKVKFGIPRHRRECDFNVIFEI